MYFSNTFLDFRMHEETSNEYYLHLWTIETLCNNHGVKDYNIPTNMV